jgi:hypothetical protein
MSCSFSGIDASNPPCSRYDFQIVGTGSFCEEKSSFLFLKPVEDAPPTARQAAFFVQTARDDLRAYCKLHAGLSWQSPSVSGI